MRRWTTSTGNCQRRGMHDAHGQNRIVNISRWPDVQLKEIAGKVIAEPTDEAGEEVCKLFWAEPPVVKDDP